MSNRTAKNRRQPYLPPVTKIELVGNPSKWRIVAVILLLAVGAFALSNAFLQLLRGDSGWRAIEPNTDQGITCGEDFVLMYNVGASSVAAAAETRALTTLYTQLAANAWQQFTLDEAIEGVNNLWAINHHPNEVLTVDPLLYHAFEQVQQYGDRTVYLGPAYTIYDDIFWAEDDVYAAYYDPYQNAEIAAWYAEIAAFAADPAAVNVQLLGENRLCLHVSDAYLAYAQQNDVTNFVDFAWLKNAFIIDYMADALLQGGYTAGGLSSYDGFARSLNTGDTSFAVNLFDSGEPMAVMEYTGVYSFATLRAYALNSRDALRCYTFADGTVRTAYLSAADGKERHALPDLTVYAKDGTATGCAELALRLTPLYVTDAWNAGALQALAGQGIYGVYTQGDTLHYTDPDIALQNLAEGKSAKLGL